VLRRVHHGDEIGPQRSKVQSGRPHQRFEARRCGHDHIPAAGPHAPAQSDVRLHVAPGADRQNHNFQRDFTPAVRGGRARAVSFFTQCYNTPEEVMAVGGGKDGVAMDRRTAGAIRTNSASADSNNSFETRRLAVDGVGITCYAAGSGRDTIVLLHGAGVASALMPWAEVMPLSAATYRVVAPDLPGSGASDRISGEYSLAFYTDMVKGVIEAVADGPVILAALSLGGGISFNLALGHPELVKVLVPVGAWGVFDKLPWHRLTYWYTRSKLNENLYAWTGKYRWFVKWSLTSSLFGDASKVSDELVDQVQQAMLQPGAGWPFISFQRSEITPSGLRTDLFGRL